MSRIGKKPIQLPQGVTVTKNGRLVNVKGPKGELVKEIVPETDIMVDGNVLTVKTISSSRRVPALWGLSRALLQNMVTGVTSGFEKKLEIEGVGYKAVAEGPNLSFSLGLSHPVKFPAPTGITLAIEKSVITVSGTDRELVGETAARIRRLKPPEPYKGKGIRYMGEVIRRKAGKKASATAA